MKLKVDWDSCEANGVCESLAPDVFHLDEDDNLHVDERHVEASAEQVRRSVASCPKMALSLEGDDGSRA